MNQSFDILVIGGGPGGYVAAIRGAQLGKKVGVIEKAHLGGVCLNWGCIPTKALLRSAEVKYLAEHGKDFGLNIKDISVDIKDVVKRSRSISNQLSKGIQHLLKKNNITHIQGHARLKGKGIVDVEGKNYSAPHIIIATGARARSLPNLPKHENIWTSKEAMIPETMPKSLLVIGSGAIGIEYASFYRDMGVDVHVVEIQDRILVQEDAEISAMAKKLFEKRGIQFSLNTSLKEVKEGKNGFDITLQTSSGDKNITATHIIQAVGVIGNTDDLGLEHTAVNVEKNQIQTDGFGETGESGIYAIGDVAGVPWLAHKASHEGIICAEKICGLHPKPLNKNHIPACTYAHPHVASIGLSETQAKELGKSLKVGRFPFQANGKALALGETDGMIKTIFCEKTGELLGAHMIGAEVTELIQGFALAMKLEATEEDIMHTIFPHPTLSEMMHESTLDAFGKAIHF
jgi:dihydrolipoamide dehydrogenase